MDNQQERTAARSPLSPALRHQPLHGQASEKGDIHYQELRAAGKTGKQALIACTRKLLVILNAILRDKKRGTVA